MDSAGGPVSVYIPLRRISHRPTQTDTDQETHQKNVNYFCVLMFTVFIVPILRRAEL